MDKYDVQLNDRAYRDLEEIFDYISNELQAPENAKGQTDRLWAALKNWTPSLNRIKSELLGNTQIKAIASC